MLRGRLVLIISVLILCLVTGTYCSAEILSGEVRKQDIYDETGIIIDNRTGMPISNATVSIPAEGINTTSDGSGRFSLKIPNKAPLILSVNADGYKPFSAIIDRNDLRLLAQESMKILMEKLSANHLVIDIDLHHLGDNSYSRNSANARDFSASADSTSFIKEFYVDGAKLKGQALLRIGSIIGIDTIIARNMRQSRVRGAASTPVKVILNSRIIGEITFNGDNKTFRIPPGLLKPNRHNRLEILTGINLNSDIDDRDYDDIEFMNVILEL